MGKCYYGAGYGPGGRGGTGGQGGLGTYGGSNQCSNGRRREMLTEVTTEARDIHAGHLDSVVVSLRDGGSTRCAVNEGEPHG